MKIFCSYAFTGEDERVVIQRMSFVVESLSAAGHEVYCDLFDENMEPLFARHEVKTILLKAFKRLAACDAVVAIVTSPRRSIGQSMELGVALNDKKPIFLFEHSSARNTSYLERIADAHYPWETDDGLKEQLLKLHA